MDTGKRLRLRRLLTPNANTGIVVPIDHGFTMGPLVGIESTVKMGSWIRDPHISAVICHKGMVERLAGHNHLDGKGLFVHVNGMSSLAKDKDTKHPVSTVERAAQLGADGISLQINFDGDNDTHNWRMLGQVTDKAAALGMPVLTMLYDLCEQNDINRRVKRLRHLLRSTIELGSDAIKIAMPRSRKETEDILGDTVDDVLIFVAGGANCDESKLISQIVTAVEFGAAGVCIGRNVFNRSNSASFLFRLATAMGRERHLRAMNEEVPIELH